MQTYTYTRHLPKILTEDEIGLIHQTILNSDSYHHNKVGDFLRWRDITAIELMYYTGLRPAECLQLKWCDLDFENELIAVRPYINKRKNDLPAILTNPAKRILMRYKQKLLELNINNEWLFPSFWTTEPIQVCSMGKKFLKICQECGLAQFERHNQNGKPIYSVSLYSLRHSFCTRIYKATGSEIAVSRLARHTQVQSASIYTHLNFDDKREIANRVFN